MSVLEQTLTAPEVALRDFTVVLIGIRAVNVATPLVRVLVAVPLIGEVTKLPAHEAVS